MTLLQKRLLLVLAAVVATAQGKPVTEYAECGAKSVKVRNSGGREVAIVFTEPPHPTFGCSDALAEEASKHAHGQFEKHVKPYYDSVFADCELGSTELTPPPAVLEQAQKSFVSKKGDQGEVRWRPESFSLQVYFYRQLSATLSQLLACVSQGYAFTGCKAVLFSSPTCEAGDITNGPSITPGPIQQPS